MQRASEGTEWVFNLSLLFVPHYGYVIFLKKSGRYVCFIRFILTYIYLIYSKQALRWSEVPQSCHIAEYARRGGRCERSD